MTTSDQVDKIFPALIKAQSEMGNAKKSCANPYFKSKYADLSEIIDVIKSVITENGLGVIQSPGGNGSAVTVACRIIHTSGQWIEDYITLNAVKNDPQAIGSAITYGRRYQLASLFNIAQEDDDGNTASGKERDEINGKNVELEKQSAILEGYIRGGVVSGENKDKAQRAIDSGNLENIVKWNAWAKKQEEGK